MNLEERVQDQFAKDDSSCIACGEPMVQDQAQIMKVVGLELESAHLYCEDEAKAIWEERRN